MKPEIDLSAARQYGSLELLAKQLVEGFITGLHKSPYHGFSVEFAEHKIYNAGESTKHVDWKLFARTDRLYTKRYEEETNLRCQIVLDTSSSMYYPAENNGKLTFSIIAAAALATLLQKQRDAVGLTVFNDGIQFQSQVKSTPSHLNTLMQYMQGLMKAAPVQRTTHVAETLHLIADKMNKRSLIVIFSDMFESSDDNELFSALRHLKHNKHEVLLFHTFHKPTEELFGFDERPYIFVDLETGEKLKLKPAEVKERYTAEMLKMNKELKQRCGQFKIDYIEADIEKGISQILIPYLSMRKKMV